MFLQNFNFLVLVESLAFVYASYAAGDAVLRHLGFDLMTQAKRFVYRILIGYGIFANIGLVLALSGFFRTPYLRVAFLVVLALSARTIINHLRVALHPAAFAAAWARLRVFFREHPFLKGLMVLWLFTNVFIVFAPITGWDALDYHLPIINDIITKGRADFTPTIPSYHYLPVLAEIFYAVPTVIFGQDGAPYIFQFLMYSVLPLLLALIYDFLRERVADRRLALAAPLLILSLFDFQREIMHAGYIDAFVFLFGIASTLALIEAAAARRARRGELLLSAAMLGIALSMKYVALFFLAINAVLLAAVSWRAPLEARSTAGGAAAVPMERRDLLLTGRAGRGAGRFIRWGMVFAGVIIAIGGYWYARNVLWFGSPVYPMFSSAEFSEAVNNFIIERTPENFFKFPFVRFGRWFSDPDETSSRLVPLAYFGALYALVPLALIVRRRLTAAELLLLLATVLWLLFSFLTSHQIRFLLPAVLLLVPLLVLLTDGILGTIRERRAWAGRVLSRLVAGALGVLFLATFLGNFHYFQIRFLYTFGVYTEEQYVGSIGSQ